MINFNRVIQIAGITDKAEADMLIDAGIKFLGFPLRLPVNKEDLSEESAAEIISSFPDDVFPVLITYLDEAAEIIKFCNKLNCSIVQLHGQVSETELRRIKSINPNISIIKSLVITGKNTQRLKETIDLSAPYCDAFITDTYDPETGASGATGKTHNWEISRSLTLYSPKPVILAGGLTPENVCRAIEFVRPAGVDSHTGVENPDGGKSKKLVKKFIEESLRGFRNISGAP